MALGIAPTRSDHRRWSVPALYGSDQGEPAGLSWWAHAIVLPEPSVSGAATRDPPTGRLPRPYLFVVSARSDHLANLLIADLGMELITVSPDLLDESVIALRGEVDIRVAFVNAVKCTHRSPPGLSVKVELKSYPRAEDAITRLPFATLEPRDP